MLDSVKVPCSPSVDMNVPDCWFSKAEFHVPFIELYACFEMHPIITFPPFLTFVNFTLTLPKIFLKL